MMFRFIEKADSYFKDNEAEIIIQDWNTLKQMTLLYMLVIVIYFIVVCTVQNNQMQDIGVIIAFIIQALYSLLIWRQKQVPVTHLKMSAWLWSFGSMIVGLAIYLGDFVFTGTNSWMFIIVLIMMTQIYSSPPNEVLFFLILYVLIFLLFSFTNKTFSIFYIDLVSTLVSLVIALLSYITSLNAKIKEAINKRELLRMCALDSMTGMNNKGTFVHRYNEFVFNREKKGSYALAIIDIDNFKRVNDIHGHNSGDDVIRTIANRINEKFDENHDIFTGRYGGDEFVVLFKSFSDESALKSAFSSWLADLKKHMYEQFGFEVTCSVGVSIARSQNYAFSRIFLVADRELYKVKKAGGNAIRMADNETAADEKPLMLCIDLRAVENDLLKKNFASDMWIIETQGKVDSINTLERYGENTALMLINKIDDKYKQETLFQEIKKFNVIHHFPIIVITDYPLSDNWKPYVQKVLTRPIDVNVLIASINSITGSWDADDENKHLIRGFNKLK